MTPFPVLNSGQSGRHRPIADASRECGDDDISLGGFLSNMIEGCSSRWHLHAFNGTDLVILSWYSVYLLQINKLRRVCRPR